MKMLWMVLLACFAWQQLHAQQDNVRSAGFPMIPKLSVTDIPGAPLLEQPMLITGTQQEIRTEKHGLVYPLLYDWNNDGKKDLLLGEFETGQTGSDIKVFLNEGTAKKPKYSGKYFYAKTVNGDTMTAHQWCCIGTHPRLADLNNDGIMDMLSGQYSPGKINWWPGVKGGFAARRFVDQEAYVEGTRLDVTMPDQLDPESATYWTYTSAGFADINGDGLIDLLVGGASNAELRYALNVGTADAPRFGMRKYLLGLDGLPLSVVKPSKEAVERAAKRFRFPHYAGVEKSFMTPVDWDGDGVLDLLVTHMYGDRKTKDPVVFFRGIQTDKGLRFEEAVSLFTAEDVQKTFPGCQPNITITDYNGDGIPDLVIGVSLPTVNGFQIDSLVAWNYIHELGIESPGKDAGRAIEWEGSLDKLRKKVDAEPGMKRYYMGKLDDYKYLTLRHRGYVYVMLGRKNPAKAITRKGVIAQDEVKIMNQRNQLSTIPGPVTYEIKVPGAVRMGQTGNFEVLFNFAEEWYGYAETKGNIAAGWIPTKVDFNLPEGFEKNGEMVLPVSIPKGGAEVYKGRGLNFLQPYKFTGISNNKKLMREGDLNVEIVINFQTCNQEQCLPPETDKVNMVVTFAL